MSESFVHFSEHTLQEIALLFMAIVYTLRLRWLLKFKAGKERQAPTGAPDTTPQRGILYSWSNIAMPWAMESTRSKMIIYIQFAIFHVGVALSILMSFLIPYAPSVMEIGAVQVILQVVLGLSFLIGIIRMIRRLSSVYMRSISTPDDYFSLMLLTAWFFFATLSVPNTHAWYQTVYFLLTAFFLIYVPFSKISHYLYYPFTRYYLGKSLGRRGSYPIKHVAQPRS